MVGLRPGWLVALCAAVVVVTAWLPWVTTTVDGGGHANAIGHAGGSLTISKSFGAGHLIVLLAAILLVAGAMAARGLSPRVASAAALVLSLVIVALALWYYHLNVHNSVDPSYGFYLCAGIAVLAVALSVWTLVLAVMRHAPPRKVSR